MYCTIKFTSNQWRSNGGKGGSIEPGKFGGSAPLLMFWVA